jgi:hypothetical protein
LPSWSYKTNELTGMIFTRNMSLKEKLRFGLLFVPFCLPVIWRLMKQRLTEPIGLLSDLSVLAVGFLLAWSAPHWLRIILLTVWAIAQGMGNELLTAMHRLPTWQDVVFVMDPEFIRKSMGGIHLEFSDPFAATSIVMVTLVLFFFPVQRANLKDFGKGMLVVLLLFTGHAVFSRAYENQSIVSRYNSLHWFVADAVSTPFRPELPSLSELDLPVAFTKTDLQGKPLVEKGRAKNILIVIMEGIPGFYNRDIRNALQTPPPDTEMPRLAEATADAMLIPDFVVHSHQTIRGLYAILCGDFSKFSFDKTKAVEIQNHPERARNALPAVLAGNGFSTHYLQAAGLTFMGKDRFMPAIGFQHVHGSEWFTEPEPYPFEWGATDPTFFKGARKYVTSLQAQGKPWMLTLLTVGTHQPYAVPEEIAAKYPSRKAAIISILDQAMAEFITDLRKDGVLDDTLVVITSDESHGSTIAEWVCSWGTAMVLAPEKEHLPRIKKGTYGLVDITASILDYKGITIPQTVIGRSFFRDYDRPREMVSYTASRLRWLTEQGIRFECKRDGSCLTGPATSLLGFPSAPLVETEGKEGERLLALAAVLDHSVASPSKAQTYRFDSANIHNLPEKVTNEWSENLAGAQYLDFPAGSKVDVSILVRAIKASPDGIRLNLTLRQWEQKIQHIPYPTFQELHKDGEEARVTFAFDNIKAQQSFSFHLTGEGKDAQVRVEEFTVKVTPG